MNKNNGIATTTYNALVESVGKLLEYARKSVATAVNNTLVQTYWQIGRYIVEYEQNGKERAEYGSGLMSRLSKDLTQRYGKGFSERNIEQMRKFYISYPVCSEVPGKSISQTLSAEFSLSWSHYLFLMGIDNKDERKFYEIESKNSNWSLRELKRQFDSSLYERLSLSRDKEKVKTLSESGITVQTPEDIVKDPYVLEFLGLDEKNVYSESDLETQIISRLETFLLELGKGYTFVGRQVRITLSEKHFYIDLVFYNRLLQCFVLIDLKIGEITHQDLGQMQMYVNFYDRFVKLAHENKTIGIVLCKKKDDALVEITLPEDNTQIFASKYQTVLPDKKTLQQLINETL